MNTEETEKYFQFPLCVLAYGANPSERLGTTVSYCVLEVGKTITAKIGNDAAQQEAAEYVAKHPHLSTPFKNWNEVHAALGASRLNVKLGNFDGTIQGHAKLVGFISTFQKAHGHDALVRIKADFLWKTLGNELENRLFSIFCALLSSMGTKGYMRITRNSVCYRMLGYRSSAIMDLALPARKDGAQPLTIRQVGTSHDKLHELQFFARARANERQTFYSIRLPQKELEAVLFRRKTYATAFHAERRASDRSLIERIKQARTSPGQGR